MPIGLPPLHTGEEQQMRLQQRQALATTAVRYHRGLFAGIDGWCGGFNAGDFRGTPFGVDSTQHVVFRRVKLMQIRTVDQAKNGRHFTW